MLGEGRESIRVRLHAAVPATTLRCMTSRHANHAPLTQREGSACCTATSDSGPGDRHPKRHTTGTGSTKRRQHCKGRNRLRLEQSSSGAVITTIFPRICARRYYAPPRVRVMSFSGIRQPSASAPCGCFRVGCAEAWQPVQPARRS